MKNLLSEQKRIYIEYLKYRTLFRFITSNHFIFYYRKASNKKEILNNINNLKKLKEIIDLSDSLETWTLGKLRKKASELGIRYYNDFDRDALIMAIRRAEEKNAAKKV